MMLRVYFLRQWDAISVPIAKERLCDCDAMHPFAGTGPGHDRIPDETTIPTFRHLLEKHQVTGKPFTKVNGCLADQGVAPCPGRLGDATILDAPSSIGTIAKARDRVRLPTTQGNARYFGRTQDQQTVRGTVSPTNAKQPHTRCPGRAFSVTMPACVPCALHVPRHSLTGRRFPQQMSRKGAATRTTTNRPILA